MQNMKNIEKYALIRKNMKKVVKICNNMQKNANVAKNTQKYAKKCKTWRFSNIAKIAEYKIIINHWLNMIFF